MPGPYHYGRASSARIATIHPDLRRVCHRVILHRDVTIIDGARSRGAQEALWEFDPPRTTLHWPDSKHNVVPPQEWSEAFDMGPWVTLSTGRNGIPWNDAQEFELMADLVFACAAAEGVILRWGGDWDMKGDRNPRGALEDLAHFERFVPFRSR